MSLARPIYENASYLITRRTTQRQFFLRPSPTVNKVLLYCIAVAARRYGLRIHTVTAMTNHYHMVVTDPRGRLPDFERWLNSMVARALNSHYGRWENFWAPEQPSNVQLIDAADVLRKVVYTLSNPVAAGLVSHGDSWPGIRLFVPGVHKVRRPDGFFDEDGDLPEFELLEIVPPPLGMSKSETLRAVCEAVAASEAAIRSTFRAAKRRFLGAQRVLAQSVMSAPASVAPRRQLSPRLAAHTTPLRIEAIRRLKQFVADYRAAFVAWKNKVSNVLFPYGTFAMAQRFGAPVAAPS